MNKYFTRLTLCAISSVTLIYSQQTQFKKNSQKKMNEEKISVITPNASPVVNNGLNFFFNADFIYWTAREDGLAFATLNSAAQATQAESNTVLQKGSSLFVNNKYSPGFKAGVGTYSPHDGWDVNLEYTWFRTSPSSSTYEGKGLSPRQLNNNLSFTKLFPFEFTNVNKRTAQATWKFRLNNFDLEIGRNFFVSHYLTLRPHLGLKGGWQRQLLTSNWTLNDVTGTNVSWTSSDFVTNTKQKQWNIGLRTGIDSAWMLSKNWSIFGDFALAALWNEFSLSRIDTATTSGSPDSLENASNFQTFNQSTRFHILAPVFEFALGLRFDLWFADDQYKFRLQAGWENQTWLYQNNLDEVFPYRKTFNTNGTNLSMQGLTLEAKIDF